MHAEDHTIDVNAADPAEMTSIPGIGEKLAEQIAALRPIRSPEDLLKIRGISPAKLEQIRPFLAFPALEEMDLAAEAHLEPAMETETDAGPERPEMAEDAEKLAAEAEDAGEPELGLTVVEPAPEPPPPPPQPKKPSETPALTRGQAYGIALTSAFIAFILGIAVTFGVLIGLNGGLRYATPTQIQNLQVDLAAQGERAEALNADIASLRTRMDNLDSLSGRVTGLEETAAALSDGQAELETELAGVSTEVAEQAGRIEALQVDSERYQGFLNGLLELVRGFADTEEAGNE